VIFDSGETLVLPGDFQKLPDFLKLLAVSPLRDDFTGYTIESG
jgi:hypothetical protein